MSKQVGDFFKFSGFLRKPQLYLKLRFVSNTFWTKIPRNSHSNICTTQIWSRICKLQDFFKVCWQWGSSFCLIFKLFITCQPKKCVTELKVIWNEVMYYKNSDSTATLLTNDSLIEGCLWLSSDKQGHRLIAFRIK